MTCTTCRSASVQGTPLELAHIVQEHAHRLERLTAEEARVLERIANCRTPALGGHNQKCDKCGHTSELYNSCSNRHCPKCQGLNEIRWVESRCEDVLPIEYFHCVFTIPDVLHPIVRWNPRAAYDLLFAAVNETLHDVARNPERLGAHIGFTAILHTWTQQLFFHPHVHCIIPGGGLSADGTKWVSSKPRFFLPTRVLSRVFRGKLLSKMENALAKRRLQLFGRDAQRLLRQAATKEWVVDCRPPFAGPEPVLRYFGRYAHRIAISNDRLVSMKDGMVTFIWKDRANGNRKKFQTVDAVEFLRRFLLHCLPRNFYRIRHFGFLSNSKRRRSVERCRELLSVPPKERDDTCETWQDTLRRVIGTDITLCPNCRQARLRTVRELASDSNKWYELPWKRKPP